MRNNSFLFILFVFTMFFNSCKTKKQESKNDNSSMIEIPYFGQISPGLIPEVFAPGLVSIDGRSEGPISISLELDEIYFGAKSKTELPAIYFSKLVGNKWTTIENTDFTKGKKDEVENPFVSHDGKRIYFTAFSSDMSDTRIWYVNRLEDSWSDARKLDLSDDDKVLLYGQAKKGDLYYYNFSKRKSYYAANKNGGFPEPREFDFDSGFYHPVLSLNEDYLVVHGYNKEDESRKDTDIFVSFKAQDGTWAKPINLGDAVNSNVEESSPTFSPDGKYLFFSRDEEDGTANVYWVSTELIERIRPNH